MFALFDVEDFTGINLKCDPERAVELRERYEAIIPGYHMSKTHWNTVNLGFDVDDELIFELTTHSYDLIYASLPKKVREANPQ
ncbi:MAG: hypothetical protein K0R65_2833 [Crocinitomicaceae bacterium]|nr:hypothetical protein [Crocinitomicaceae bacterium]